MTGYAEFYISVDIEATGPIPGDYSMSSLGAFVAGARTREGSYVRFSRHEPKNKFYMELHPSARTSFPRQSRLGFSKASIRRTPPGSFVTSG